MRIWFMRKWWRFYQNVLGRCCLCHRKGSRREYAYFRKGTYFYCGNCNGN